MPVAVCWDCRLPDPYHGQGDGIGSCECPRCERCGGRPLRCNCSDYDDDDYWDEAEELVS